MQACMHTRTHKGKALFTSNAIMSSFLFLRFSLVCCSHGCLLSGSSKDPSLRSSEGKFESQVKYLPETFNLVNGVAKWWKPFCIPGRSNVTAHNLSKQDAWILFFTKWWSWWLKSRIPMVIPSSHPTPKEKEGLAGKRKILSLTNDPQKLPTWLSWDTCFTKVPVKNFTYLREK